MLLDKYDLDKSFCTHIFVDWMFFMPFRCLLDDFLMTFGWNLNDFCVLFEVKCF